MIDLTVTKRTDERLLQRMAAHYSQPRGFVGRNICYAITHDGMYYGHIVGGSATRFLPNRNKFFDITIGQLNNIVNNIFYSVHPVADRYPIRNFTSAVVLEFERRIAVDWQNKYGDVVLGLETLIELPRTGELYRRVGWIEVGTTHGFTCKRVGGSGTDTWTGKRVWNTDPQSLRPKLVLVKRV